MNFRNLSTRIALLAGFFVLVSVAGLSVILIRSQREQVLSEVVRGSEGIADALRLTVHHDMRINRRDGVREMIEAASQHPGIEAVRVFNKNGRISFSSRPGEVGEIVDRSDPACVSCHSGPVPARDLDPRDRSRIYTTAGGERLLETIRVITNEDGCQGSGCHAPPTDQDVLGVLEVSIALDSASHRLAASTGNAAILSLGAVLFITAVLFFLVRGSVDRPIGRLVDATRRVTQEDAQLEVPEGAAREIRILGKAFSELVESLSSSRSRLEDWASTLEQKVAEKVEELHEAQFQVARAEKLSSVGLVAAGIAHELNSPLMAINTFAHLVRKEIPEDSQAYEDLRMIEREANRCAAIVRQLLDFSRRQEESGETTLCAIAPAAKDALELLKVEIQNAGVEAHASIPADLPPVEANQVQLQQVFVNLILNAVQAMPAGGELHIESTVVSRGEYGDADLPPHPAERLVRTTVRDTGIGIPHEDLAKVFDPFFTTKGVGQGSGLGLSVSLGLIRGYRGTILVESEPGEGTEFTVLIPVAQPRGSEEP